MLTFYLFYFNTLIFYFNTDRIWVRDIQVFHLHFFATLCDLHLLQDKKLNKNHKEISLDIFNWQKKNQIKQNKNDSTLVKYGASVQRNWDSCRWMGRSASIVTLAIVWLFLIKLYCIPRYLSTKRENLHIQKSLYAYVSLTGEWIKMWYINK